MADRRIPGGYGRTGAQDAFIREKLLPRDDGWMISTVGDSVNGHQDVTGVLMTQDLVSLRYVPERSSAVSVYEARISVATAVASSTITTGLFMYKEGTFRLIPGTKVTFETASTGRKIKTLPESVQILPIMRLFLGIYTAGGAPALEGYQSGAGGAPRVVRERTASGQNTLQNSYELGSLTASGTADCPLVVYLSQEAAAVL